jgi:hypothetical protein
MKILRTVRFIVCPDQSVTASQHRVRFHNFHWCYKLEDGTWVYEESTP